MFYVYCTKSGFLVGDRYESWFINSHKISVAKSVANPEEFESEEDARYYLYTVDGEKIPGRSLVKK